MREAGLQEAIAAAGGVSELARRLGLSPPSISTWTRVPAERVAAVEAATGIPRETLRPDLFGSDTSLDPLEAERADAWRLLAELLVAPPDAARLQRLARLQPGQGAFGEALGALAEAARRATAEAVEREYFTLFIGVGRGEILPYASWYLTGSLNDRPLAKLRADMRELGIESDPGVPEPEDHAGRLAEMMAGLIRGPFQAPLDVQRGFFRRHLEPWAGRLFDDVTRSDEAKLYRAVGRVGAALVALESEAFALAA